MRDYPLKLDKYGIDCKLYRQLYWQCRRYPDHLARLSAARGGFNRTAQDGMPRSTDTSDPTARRAERALRLREEIEIIEQSAIEAESSLYQQIIKNVAYGVKYEDMACPCGRRQFYDARRKFFWILAQKLDEIG